MKNCDTAQEELLNCVAKGLFLLNKMQFNKSLFLLLYLPVVLIFASCSSKTKSQRSAVKENPVQNVNKKAFDEAFYEGNKQMVLGNYQEAAAKFKICVSLDAKNSTAAYLLAKEYNALRQFDYSLMYAREAVKLDGGMIWYRLLEVDDLTHLNKNPEAAKEYEFIADKFSNNESCYFDAAEQFMISGKSTDALRVLDKLEKKKGVSEEVSFKKEEIYIKLNKKDEAIAELQKLIKTYPKQARYQVALAEVYFGFKEDAKAMDIINEALKADPDMPEAHLLLANIYRNKGENEKSFEELKIVFANPDADIRQKIQILSSYLPLINGSEKMRNQAMQLGELLTKAHPNEAAGNMMYGDILFSSEKFAEAKIYYIKAISSGKSNPNLWENLIQCEDNLKQYDSAQIHAEDALEAFPAKVIFYYYKAYYALRLKDYSTAVSAAKAGYDLGSENTRVIIQLLTIEGDALNAQKKYAESDAAYDKVLEIDPNNLQTLNNYAYYLSLRKDKLDKAESMSKKTLDLDPGNPTYLDTYGWVLYCEGKYAEAKTYIEKALEKMPDNPVLNEHLGDIYYRLNNIGKAVDYWKISRDKGNSSDSLTQKINTKKLEEQ